MLALALALIAAATAPPALAHRAPGTATTIAWNPRTGMTEVVHRLHVHDALTGIAPLVGRRTLEATPLEDQAQMALYVEKRFALALEDGTPVALRTLGAELDHDYLLIYQESDVHIPPGTALRVRNGILRDAFPEQINVVYWRSDTSVRNRTIRLQGKDEWVAFAPAGAPSDAGNVTDEPGT